MTLYENSLLLMRVYIVSFVIFTVRYVQKYMQNIPPFDKQSIFVYYANQSCSLHQALNAFVNCIIMLKSHYLHPLVHTPAYHFFTGCNIKQYLQGTAYIAVQYLLLV